VRESDFAWGAAALAAAPEASCRLQRGAAGAPLGARARILPNHACATTVRYDRCRVVRPGSDAVIAARSRIKGW
jgi:D-serine deaminase-like pyridoxal phosphate-dependent protein